MNTAIANQTEHLADALRSLDIAPDTRSALLVAGTLVQALGMRIKVEALARDIERIESTVEIDPDGQMAEALLELQRRVNALHARCRDLGARSPGVRLLRRVLRSIHARLGEARVFILEFDVDILGPSGAGPFTNAGDLFRHLDGL